MVAGAEKADLAGKYYLACVMLKGNCVSPPPEGYRNIGGGVWMSKRPDCYWDPTEGAYFDIRNGAYLTHKAHPVGHAFDTFDELTAHLRMKRH